jgi:hypothetical protein
MDTRFQPGQHPDPDQLNAFMEMALPEHERMETLAHLAECEECRTIAFLAQKDLLPEPQVLVKEELQPWWKNWWRPLPVATMAFACLFLIVASVGVFRVLNKNGKTTYEAKSLPSEPVQNHATESSSKPQTEAAPQSEISVKKPLQKKPVSPAAKEQLRQAVPEQSPSQPVVGTAPPLNRGVAGGVMGGIGTAPHGGPAISPAPPASPSSQAFLRRNQTPQPASGVAAPSLDAAANSVVINGRNIAALPITDPLHLTIEHGRAADDGLAELRGTVRDASGAVIPRATVSLHGLSGQANADTASDAGGAFTIPSLPAGQYEIQVSSIGFQSLKQRINLIPRDLAQIEPVLPVGSTSQAVEVTAEAPVLQTESAQVSTVSKKSPEGTFVSQLELSDTVLAFDSNGTLFRKESGKKSWKKIKPKWHGAVVQLSSVPGKEGGSTSLPSFLIATSSGESWISPDGRHWTKR